MRGRVLMVMACTALMAAACGSGVAKATVTTKPPLPAGKNPSAISRVVCDSDTSHEIASALGEKAVVTTPTWVGHLYSCRLAYPSAAIGLSVKELSSWAETISYFQGLASRMGKTRVLDGLGQGAFQTTNGSVVVRKDFKVLLVDPSDLPAQFGQPPTSAAAVAVTVADVILGCWAGD